MYEIKYRGSVKKDLRKIPKKDLSILIGKVFELSENPRPSSCTKLAGYDNIYRIRYRVYRVVYEVRDSELIIVVIKVGHRKDIYEKL